MGNVVESDQGVWDKAPVELFVKQSGKSMSSEVFDLTIERGLHIYEQMLLSRRFDEFINARIADGDDAPHFHSGIGQEALSVAAVATLKRDDYMIYSHRGYAHLLAKGVSLRTIILDMLLKVGGSNDGFGGVLHVASPEIGIVGRNGAFGTNFGIGAGLALSALKQRNGRVAMLFYGEAAGSRGPLYEALNLAVLWKLPLILIAENNGYSISSRTETLYPNGRMSGVWRGFDIPVEVIDGNDACTVFDACTRAVARARSGGGPSVIEGLTYRIDGHRPVIDDHLSYRSVDEIENWKKRDPLNHMRTVVLSRGWQTVEEMNALEQVAEEQISAAWTQAQAAPRPSQELFNERMERL